MHKMRTILAPLLLLSMERKLLFKVFKVLQRGGRSRSHKLYVSLKRLTTYVTNIKEAL